MKKALFLFLAATAPGLAVSVPAAAQEQAAAETSPGAFGLAAEEYEAADDVLLLLKKAFAHTSFADIERAASAGNLEAVYLTAIAYHSGTGVTKDTDEARRRMQRAALGGFRRALTSYGSMLYEGIGGPKDVAGALNLWQTAADAGNPTALGRLGEYYQFAEDATQRDFSKARDLYRRAADKGSSIGFGGLAGLALLGIGQDADPAAAVALYRQAADRGSSYALYRLGIAYRQGAGVERDFAASIDHLERAARQGYRDALHSLAGQLSDGADGVPPNPRRAAALLHELAAPDDWAARDHLAFLIINGAAPPIKGLDAIALAEEASVHGKVKAIGSLAANLREGRNGYAKDRARAAAMSRTLLARLEALPMTSPEAWPLYARGAAYTIQVAIADGAIEELPGEVRKLERRYGKFNGRMVWMDPQIKCGGGTEMLKIYLWDVDSLESPSDAQFDWIEQSQGCAVPLAVRLHYRRLFDLARATAKSYPSLAVDHYDARNKPPTPPLAF